jgi:hypothetical protein
MDKFHLERPFSSQVLGCSGQWNRFGAEAFQSNGTINLNRTAGRVTRHQQKRHSLIAWKILVNINHSDLAEILTSLRPFVEFTSSTESELHLPHSD